MKTYAFNFATYGIDGLPTDYDYTTASLLWEELDELNESCDHHTVTLDETASGSLVLCIESDETKSLPALLEKVHVAHEIERIADEYGGFEIPDRYLLGERELNEIRSAI